MARPGGIEPTSIRKPYGRRRSTIELRAHLILARSAGIEPAASEIITLGTLPTELQARCSFQQRKSGKKFLEQLPVGRLNADRHRLPAIWSVGLDNQVSRDTGHLQLRAKPAKLRLILGEKRNSVGAFRQVFGRTAAGGVDQLGGLGAGRNVGAGDAVVGEVLRGRNFAAGRVTVNVKCSCGGGSHRFSESASTFVSRLRPLSKGNA